ncbi:LEF-7 [Choristoneura rosaceana nucleopolyhedrovirus]|uniref:LEF-7 n=1 Tax=Choristoneura rosaceana nucleopolyhedrovirus TaxID=58094 RepID=S5MKT3_9ABAC|nr:LEF-7 [Choristoneura rosaceana nucleopolyhedrovirus]AGR57071.1 LEF-7 [Choristoneura rosaceana nucleopolyhedrovirus]
MRQRRPRFSTTGVLVKRVLILDMRQRRPRFSTTGVLEKRVLILDMRQRRPRFSTTGVLEKRVLIFNMTHRRPRFSTTGVLEKRVLILDMRQRRPRFSTTGVLVKRVLILDMRQRRPRFSTTGVLEKRVLILDMRQRRPRFSTTGVLEKRVLILDMRQRRRPRFLTICVSFKIPCYVSGTGSALIFKHQLIENIVVVIMEPPNKRCKLCHQTFLALPHLPVEIVDRILTYLPFKLHVEVMGVSAATRRRALLRPDRFMYYFKYDPFVDDAFATHWAIEADDPARPYLGRLCRFECPLAAQQFFNEHVPRAVALCMFDAPRVGSENVLSRRWGWWRLARAVFNHEARCGYNWRLTRVCVDADDLWIEDDVVIFDSSMFEFDGQPDSTATVTINDVEIELIIYNGRVHRIYK